MTDGRSPRLRRQWRGVTVALAAALITAGISLDASPALPRLPGLTDSAAVQWAVPTAATGGFVVWFCRRHLDANRHDTTANAGEERSSAEGESPSTYATLGVANAVTVGRGGLFAAVAGFVAVDPAGRVVWLPAVCYGTGCVLDLADGAIARLRGRTTILGAKLDMAVDTLGFLVAPVVAVVWGRLPVWYLSLSAARYLFKAGRGYRRASGRPVYDLPPSAVRRPLAGVQMAFISIALAPVLPAATVRALAAVVLAPSLAVFARDYLVVSGRLSPGTDDG
ncbi:CDP-alcohol phosphatidyltransferase [Halorubrum saccharovorum DSM 1137]|uniref:CDP-alcohol phosphatidyltransferase n=1 Tax=Halorubrum saccharovorum DSM 1137 TaxID=1227484 RepID=M0E3W5_9EURY|nr:CDP-alcohol phosphatidyltransferase family protein [Halorubrum saccharovorum]ELZ42470.1 CDP-alcohol phosphatidyltransferase [Halorubrum saccharovorum DSM 1137]